MNQINEQQLPHHHEQQQSYAGVTGISQLGTGQQQQQQGIRLLQNILQKNQLKQAPKNVCVGSARLTTEGGDDTKLSGDVSLVASGVAKDCTEEDLKGFLAGKGINVVDVEKLTKPDVLPMVRTITFRVAVKAADYEAALKPEVRHYRAPRRPAPDRADGGWRGQSSQSGGSISSDNTGGSLGARSKGNQSNGGGGGHPSSGHHLPPGHAGRVGSKQQFMSPRQPNQMEMSNFWNILHTLGGDVGLASGP